MSKGEYFEAQRSVVGSMLIDGEHVAGLVMHRSREEDYDLCVNAMVLDSWEHRDLKEPASQVSENVVFRRMLNQLKHTEVSNLNTEG